jgi:hypothetical protein
VASRVVKPEDIGRDVDGDCHGFVSYAAMR